MKTVGLITEYNPFHNGHLYHIEKAKELTGADRIIVVMSGNYVQRGVPAMMPKELRTEAALRCGASLVIELPVCYSTGTAEQFAYGAVSILNKLGCVDFLCFGSESGNLKQMNELAQILVEEPVEFQTRLQEFVRKGYSFPLSRQKAVCDLYPDSHFSELLEQPNNILGIEYLKALLRLNSKIKPFTIKRFASDYHENRLNDKYSSASAIRHVVKSEVLDDIYNQVPETVFDLYKNTIQKRYPVWVNDFSLLLKYRLLSEDRQSLTQYADISEELANRIINNLKYFMDFEQFCELLKTKEVTYSRISRALLHVLLNISTDDDYSISYARMLGFRKEHADLLSLIKKTSSIPLISKCTEEFPMLKKDIFASNLYESVITQKLKQPVINEYEHPIIRI